MTQFFYSGSYIMLRTGRESPNAFTQIKDAMPAPEAVLVSGRAASGWSLSTWRQVAKTRHPRLANDMLAVIDELQREEVELAEKYQKSLNVPPQAKGKSKGAG